MTVRPLDMAKNSESHSETVRLERAESLMFMHCQLQAPFDPKS